MVAVDMTAHFCPVDVEGCRYASGRSPLYRDAHHLNVEGATDAQRAIAAAMRRGPAASATPPR